MIIPRRIYLYTVTTLVFLYTVLLLQHIIYALLVRLGLTDTSSPVNFLDLVYNLSIYTFSKVHAVVDLIIIAIGVVHYYWIHQEIRSDDTAAVSGIRAFFLAWLACSFGLRVIFACIVAILQVNPQFQTTPPIATQVAIAVTWLIGLGAIAIEWSTVHEPFERRGQAIIKWIALFGQWILTITALFTVSQFIQSLLQMQLNPLPYCVGSGLVVAIFGGGCTILPPLLSASGIVVIAGVGLYAYRRWATRYEIVALVHLDAFVMAVIIGGTIAYSGAQCLRLIFDLAFRIPATFVPDSFLTDPPGNVASYPYLGFFIAGLVAMSLFLWRAIPRWREDRIDRFYSYIAWALVSAASFFLGGYGTLANILLVIAHKPVMSTDWSQTLSFLPIGTVGWLYLWNNVQLIARGGRRGIVTIPGRIYTYILLIGTMTAAVISLIIIALLLFTALYHIPLDPSGTNIYRAISVFLISVPFAYLFWRIPKTWR